MRHLYNEDFSDFENAIKQQEDNINSNQGAKDKNSERKCINERHGSSNDLNAEANRADEDQTKSPEDLIQSFSTLSGIALPMESRFVWCLSLVVFAYPFHSLL